MKKRFYMIAFLVVLASSVELMVAKARTATRRKTESLDSIMNNAQQTEQQKASYIDSFFNWFDGLMGRAEKEAEKEAKEAAARGKFSKKPLAITDGSQPKPKRHKPKPLALTDGSEYADDAREALNLGDKTGNSIMIGAMTLKAQEKISDDTFNTIKYLVEAFKGEGNFEQVRENLLISVRNCNQGHITGQALDKHVQDLHRWYLENFDIADEYQGENPVEQVLTDDDDNWDFEEPDWDDDEDEFPVTPVNPDEEVFDTPEGFEYTDDYRA